MKKIFFTLFCCLCTVVANAEEYTDANGVTWTYSYNTYYKIIITAATGLGENVVCPDVITHDGVEYPVTSIGSIFQSNTNIKTVELPDGLTSIGSNAFNSCTNLTSVNISENVVSIESSAFKGCSSLTSINIPESVTSIGSSAFYGCSSLTSITLPENMISIGSFAFQGCSNLASVNISKGVTCIESCAFYDCSSLTSITIPESVTSIGSSAFYGCSNLTSINMSKNVTSIGGSAFNSCTSLTSITIPESVTSIGSYAFGNCYFLSFVKMEGTTPPSLSPVSNNVIVFVVPDKAAYENYCAHTDWQGVVTQLTYEDAATQSVKLEANNDVSALYTAIGEENLKFVYDLTIEGTFNGADIYIIRNKMPTLRKLNLSQARIVSGGGAYYRSYTTEDDVLGTYAFSTLNLCEVNFPKQLSSIENYAFYDCYYLQRIEIPEGVTSIGNYAFGNCRRLRGVSFPKTLKDIKSSAFGSCYDLAEIVLPIGLETIENNAFSNCTSLKEIRFPSGLNSLGSGIFSSCEAITDVYAYTIEPVDMTEGTFTTNVVQSATLHYPLTSKYNYYTNGGWGQFLNMEEFDEPYEYFYLNNDYTLNKDNGGVIDGTPDVDINEGGGLIVEDDLNGEEDTQHSNDMNIHHNGGHGGDGVSGSLIANGNFHANKLHFHIDVKGGKWHFFAFPFNVKKENIKCENKSDWVFYYYDGKERANNGKGGWKKVSSEEGQGNFLKAGVGYIFQSSMDDVLVITVDEDDDAEEEGIRVKKDNKNNALEAHASQNEQDASWNFTGNPHLSYYDLDTETYNAPITVWDGDKYVAVRPGDDDYQLAPFQAFFVQKPEGVDAIAFKGDNQMTHHQKENKVATTTAYASTRGNGRLIVNVTLEGGGHSDNTRVVFNNAQKMSYEMTCDAAKFATADVPQLYTLDNRKVKYAINERPQEEGTVPMGYSVPAYGSYTIDAPRMDTPMMLKDLQTGSIHDFSEGSYEFTSEAGSFDNRFVLMTRAAVTGIDVAALDNIKVTATEGAIEVSQLGGATLNVFTASGEKVATSQTDGVIPVVAGIYVVEADGKSVKVIVK